MDELLDLHSDLSPARPPICLNEDGIDLICAPQSLFAPNLVTMSPNKGYLVLLRPPKVSIFGGHHHSELGYEVSLL